jgi:non-heme chloroperoxidase
VAERQLVDALLYMIHGMWGTPWYWDKYRRAFEAEGLSCVTPTLRHHDMDALGEPPPGLGTTSLLDYAADLQGEVGTLACAPIIIGHSMGGLLAQVLASRGLARAAVLLTPAAPSGILALTPSVIRSFGSVLSRWNDRFVYESGRAAAELGFWAFDRHRAAHVEEAQVTCPLLIIGAGQDRITPASVVRRVAAKYRRVSTYVEFPDHAHWVVGEPGWEKIVACVLRWMRENGLNRRA